MHNCIISTQDMTVWWCNLTTYFTLYNTAPHFPINLNSSQSITSGHTKSLVGRPCGEQIHPALTSPWPVLQCGQLTSTRVLLGFVMWGEPHHALTELKPQGRFPQLDSMQFIFFIHKVWLIVWVNDHKLYYSPCDQPQYTKTTRLQSVSIRMNCCSLY